MIKDYSNLMKKYSTLILTLGFAYGATIVFTFWGPILNIAGGKYSSTLSIIAVLAHVLGFYLKPFSIESNKHYFVAVLVVLVPLVFCFYRASFQLKAFTVILYAFFIARIGCFWAYKAKQIIPNHIRGRIISASLFISFTILYFVNMLIPIFNKEGILILPIILCILAVAYLNKVRKEYESYQIISSQPAKKIPSVFLFTFLIIVYIAGGFSYAGIYPSLAPFVHIDRYYNVLFYVIAILVGGVILDTYGRKIAFTLGVAFLGISFTFFIMPSTVFTYFTTQTFLQAGWAFVNSFGWSFSWDMAEQSNRPEMFPRGISAMLFGASTGAVLVQMISSLGIANSSVYGVVTFIPLFIAIIFLVYFPETLMTKKVDRLSVEVLNQMIELNKLTPRELEVSACLANGSSNKDICSQLYISENTVKTHIRNIYSKLEISSRSELKEYINKCLKKII